MKKRARPLTLEEQWDKCDEWHQMFSDGRAVNYPVPDGLNEAWEELDALYRHPGEKPLFERGRALTRTGSTPLSVLMYFIESGFYPPPELLLTLADAWDNYMQGNGAVTLEEAFLGPPIPKGGNYAKRHHALIGKGLKSLQMGLLRRNGLSVMEAAEKIAVEFGGEPETIARTVRQFTTAKPEK